MTPTPLCPDDLLLAARRGELTLQDDARLAFHLKSCRNCQVALETGRSFDAALGARIRDDEIAMRIAARVSPRRTRKWVPLAISGGVLLSASLAVAEVRLGALSALFRTHAEPTAKPAAATTAIVRRAPNDGPTAPLAGTPDRQSALPYQTLPHEPALIHEATSSPETAASQEAAAPKEPLKNVSRLSAGLLFAEANALRSGGKGKEAEKRYVELQSRFPASTEAKVSLVSLARLELGSRPGLALRHFDSYLAQSAHTTLMEEALFGRASALGRLGRTAPEQAAWRELLRRYPASVYAERARAKLETAP